jgi:RNA polymerase sigma factor (sigma-70 family)
MPSVIVGQSRVDGVYVKQQFTFINCKDETRLRRLLERLVRRIERRLSAARLSEAPYLHGTIEKNPAHERYRVSILLNVPGRTLVAKEEGHKAEPVIREAVDELERQLNKHLSYVRQEPLWKRPARRAAIPPERLKEEIELNREEKQKWLRDEIHADLQRLYSFVRREIAASLAAGDLRRGEIKVEDVIDAVIERALSQADSRPANLDVNRWLLKLSLEYLDAEVARLKKERASGVHIKEETPAGPFGEGVDTQTDEIFDFYQPDEDLRLEDLVPHPYVPSPEQVNESRDLQRYVNQTLAEMPQAWRRSFVLRHVEGFSVDEVARILDMTDDEVNQDLEHALVFLRQKVVESGLNVAA